MEHWNAMICLHFQKFAPTSFCFMPSTFGHDRVLSFVVHQHPKMWLILVWFLWCPSSIMCELWCEVLLGSHEAWITHLYSFPSSLLPLPIPLPSYLYFPISELRTHSFLWSYQWGIRNRLTLWWVNTILLFSSLYLLLILSMLQRDTCLHEFCARTCRQYTICYQILLPIFHPLYLYL